MDGSERGAKAGRISLEGGGGGGGSLGARAVRPANGETKKKKRQLNGVLLSVCGEV